MGVCMLCVRVFFFLVVVAEWEVLGVSAVVERYNDRRGFLDILNLRISGLMGTSCCSVFLGAVHICDCMQT